MTNPAPVRGADRLIYWDVLRGFALFGVLMANMPVMSLVRAVEWTNVDLSHGGRDTFAFYLVRAIADTKFITIFSILFGAGLALMSEKASERGQPFKRLYTRRLAALFLFGVLHGVFIWFGDILAHYAVVGFFAMWFRRLRPWLLTTIALALLVLTSVLMNALSTFDPHDFFEPPEGQTVEEMAREHRERCLEAFSSGGFAFATEVRLELFVGGSFLLLLWAPRTLALFLFGIALVRSGILVRLKDHLHLAKRAIWVGFVVGVPLQVIHLFVAADLEDDLSRHLLDSTLFWTAVFLSPAYMGVVAFWVEGDRLRWLRDGLAAVGRMAFTNYILQSVITGVIFNYLGQYDRWDRFEGLVLTFGVFAFQIVASRWWLRRFRFGPLEWLWRTITYWRWQRFRDLDTRPEHP